MIFALHVWCLVYTCLFLTVAGFGLLFLYLGYEHIYQYILSMIHGSFMATLMTWVTYKYINLTPALEVNQLTPPFKYCEVNLILAFPRTHSIYTMKLSSASL